MKIWQTPVRLSRVPERPQQLTYNFQASGWPRAPTGDRLEEDSLDTDVREYLDDRRPGSAVPSGVSSCWDPPRMILVLREPPPPGDSIQERPLIYNALWHAARSLDRAHLTESLGQTRASLPGIYNPEPRFAKAGRFASSGSTVRVDCLIVQAPITRSCLGRCFEAACSTRGIFFGPNAACRSDPPIPSPGRARLREA